MTASTRLLPDRPIDLRSDTRTMPDAAMRKAMAAADVGDDSFGDDPTVQQLEERAARLLGKPAAIFTCSGTMSNLLAVLALGAGPGARVVAGADAHLVHYENDGARILAGADVVTASDGPHGELGTDDIERALRRPPGMRAVLWLENTSNRRGGNALDRAALERQAGQARAAAAAIHLDGARLPNAAVALRTTMRELAEPADTVAVSLCKGLGAPAGSVLCGPVEVIDRARHHRRMVGGTMHQTGILAAAGLLALDRLPELAADHRRAAELAGGLRDIPGLTVAQLPLPTNMVLVRARGTSADVLSDMLTARGVLGLPLNDRDVRLVVHRDHEDEHIETAVRRCASLRVAPADEVRP